MDYQQGADSEFYNHPFYGKMRRRLMRIASRLGNTSVSFKLVGITHAGSPGDEIYRLVDDSDIVALELSRTIVTQSDVGLHVGNEFWEELVDYTKAKGKLAYGVNLNRNAVSALKRYLMHLRRWPLPSPFVMELFVNSVDELDFSDKGLFYLPEKDFARFRENRFVTSEDSDAYKKIQVYFVDQWEAGRLKHPTLNQRVFTYELNGKPHIRLWINLKQVDADKHSVTFFLPPHISLMSAYSNLKKSLREIDYESNEGLLKWTAMKALAPILFAPSSLTEAEETTYVLDQAIKRGLVPLKDQIAVTHIGGRGHMYPIADLLQNSTPRNARMKVVTVEDPRLPPFKGNIFMFLLDKVPIEEACNCVTFRNNDVVVDANKAVNLVMSTIEQHRGKYLRSLEYAKIDEHNLIEGFSALDNIPGEISLEWYKVVNSLMQMLDQLNMDDVITLRKRLEQRETTYKDVLERFGIAQPSFQD